MNYDLEIAEAMLKQSKFEKSSYQVENRGVGQRSGLEVEKMNLGNPAFQGTKNGKKSTIR